jgi:hypothetical protein
MNMSYLTVTKTFILTLTADCRLCSRSQVQVQARPQDTCNSGGVHPFSRGPSELRIQGVPHVNKDSMHITIFILFFMEVIHSLVTGTKKYYSQYLDT